MDGVKENQPLLETLKQARDALDLRCGSYADERKTLIPNLNAAIEQLEKEEPITDAVMNLVDRLGSEARDVDPRAWAHLAVYVPHPAAPLPDDVAAMVATLRKMCLIVVADMLERLARELAKHQESSFHPDWSMLEAARESLREHQQELAKSRELLCAHEAAVQMNDTEWREYLKDDETPIARLKREIADNHAVLGLLAKAREELATVKAENAARASKLLGILDQWLLATVNDREAYADMREVTQWAFKNTAITGDIDALLLDSERLDHLESRKEWSIQISDHPSHEGETYIELYSIDGCRNDREYNLRGGGYTLRAAIDAARKGGK